jgi:hypothetical protein
MRSILLAWAFIVGVLSGYVTGRQQLKTPSLQARDTLRIIEKQLDTLYKVQRVAATKWRTEYDTARVTDTLMRADTVYVRRDIADSAIQACSVLVSTCERRVMNLSTQLRVMDDAFADEQREAQRWKAYTIATAIALGIAIIK